MIKKFTPFVVSVCVGFLSGCGSSIPVVATVGTEKVTLDEFEESFAKNNGGWEASEKSTIEDRQKYLDLLLKFKLKLQDAHSRGLLQDTSVQNEMEGYKISVAQSYMLEKELVGPSVRKIYDRRLEEVRASHILIRVSQNASPADTLAAYTKTMVVLNLVATRPFDSLAIQYSEDPSAKTNGGDLGYFSAGRMVPDFEDACYSLKRGEYTKIPTRTQFGYHIIKLTDRRPNPGTVRISHLLRKFDPSMKDTATVRDSVWSIYRQIKRGMSFETAVDNYTDDVASVLRGGDIGLFDRDRLPQEIGAVVFNTPVDSITTPVRFNYGYHIFKVTQRKAVPPFSELEKDLKTMYQQQRYQTDYENYIHGLKKKYNLNFDVAVLHKLTHSFDTTKTIVDSAWSRPLAPDILKSVLFTCGTARVTVEDFVRKVNASPELRTYNLTPFGVEKIVDRVLELQVIEEHAKEAPMRHPAFANLMKEYEEGILIYRVEQDEVWKNIVVNDSLLKIHYDSTKQRYHWPNRVALGEIYVLSDSVVQAAYWKLRYGENFFMVAEDYTMRPGYRDRKGVWELQSNTTNQLYTTAWYMPVDSFCAPFKYESGWSIVKTLMIDSARTKTFQEAAPELVSSYQEQASKLREEEWIGSLKKKYSVMIHQDILSESFRKKRP